MSSEEEDIKKILIASDYIDQFAQLVSEIDISKYNQKEFANIVSAIQYEFFEMSPDEEVDEPTEETQEEVDEESSEEEKEKAHDKFWYDLTNASKEASETVGTMHVLYLGMEYFASECKSCAPNKEEAREMMINVIDRVLGADDHFNDDDDGVEYDERGREL